MKLTKGNKNHNFLNQKQRVFWATIIFCVIFLAFLYEIAEIGHECEGENCPICSCLQHVNELHAGRNDGGVVGIVCLGMTMLTLGILWIIRLLPETLVDRKVRLNN